VYWLQPAESAVVSGLWLGDRPDKTAGSSPRPQSQAFTRTKRQRMTRRWSTDRVAPYRLRIPVPRGLRQDRQIAWIVMMRPHLSMAYHVMAQGAVSQLAEKRTILGWLKRVLNGLVMNGGELLAAASGRTAASRRPLSISNGWCRFAGRGTTVLFPRVCQPC
jgi:hypothetical protein